jgi:hypothetical protein
MPGSSKVATRPAESAPLAPKWRRLRRIGADWIGAFYW